MGLGVSNGNVVQWIYFYVTNWYLNRTGDVNPSGQSGAPSLRLYWAYGHTSLHFEPRGRSSLSSGAPGRFLRYSGRTQHPSGARIHGIHPSRLVAVLVIWNIGSNSWSPFVVGEANGVGDLVLCCLHPCHTFTWRYLLTLWSHIRLSKPSKVT